MTDAKAAMCSARTRNSATTTEWVTIALSQVACYTIDIDFFARDHNRAPESFDKLDWIAGKANDTCCRWARVWCPHRLFRTRKT